MQPTPMDPRELAVPTRGRRIKGDEEGGENQFTTKDTKFTKDALETIGFVSFVTFVFKKWVRG